MKIKIRDLYFDDFVKELEKRGYELVYNDDNGIYNIPKLDLIIKKWNYIISIGSSSNYNDNTLARLIEIMQGTYSSKYFEIIKDEEND